MKYEWLYFWGRLSNGKFFHFAHFKKGEREYSHLSYDGRFFEDDQNNWKSGKYYIETPILSLQMYPNSIHICHFERPKYYYYSLPYLSGSGRAEKEKVIVEAWLEYESGYDLSPANWTWVAIKLDSNMACIVYAREQNSFAKIIYQDKAVESLFDFDQNMLYLSNIGVAYYLQPIETEIIFHPKNGRAYSEQPLNILFRDKVIGYGMREQTYK